MREIRCDICGKKIVDTDNMSIISFEFTDNNFHCDLDKTQQKYIYECCHECAYEFNDFEMSEVAVFLGSKILKAKDLKTTNQSARK